MTNDEKAKAYDMALEAARKELGVDRKELEVVQHVLHNIFPELRESEDERIRKKLYHTVMGTPNDSTWFDGTSKEAMLAWLEKQKEQKELPLMDGNADLYFDEWNQQKQNPTKRQCFEEGIRYAQRLQKEQKPNSTEDMPYITDEHFYEREPVDSFKYKLAEYMTRCCTKKEGPYGYEYGISAESILKMAEEELLKRGVVQKPAEWSEKHIADVFEKVGLAKIVREQGNDALTNAVQSAMLELRKVGNAEWSEEDEDMLNSCISSIEEAKENRYAYKETDGDTSYDHEIAWLESLRPSWKPSEEQMDALAYASQVLCSDLSPRAAKAGEELEGILEHFKKL